MIPNPPTPPPCQAGKVSPPLLIALVLCVLIVSGAAVAGTYFLMRGQDKTTAESKPVKEPLPDPVFVAVEPFTINLQDDSGRVLYVRMSLKVADDKTATYLNSYMPQVRNRILMTVSDQRADELVTSEGKQQLASMLRERIAQPLADGEDPIAVNDVLFTDFIVQ
ncbi:flagellar basal body-associated protein FliL [Salinisphaera aquimarina]|uniref:Flagellar protein FliL n=1 Tax=Salinisphaera aquimarina TaxID=2094031 RepID=A0ABV7EQL7_9GAMM